MSAESDMTASPRQSSSPASAEAQEARDVPITYFASPDASRISFVAPEGYTGVHHVSGAFYPPGRSGTVPAPVVRGSVLLGAHNMQLSQQGAETGLGSPRRVVSGAQVSARGLSSAGGVTLLHQQTSPAIPSAFCLDMRSPGRAANFSELSGAPRTGSGHDTSLKDALRKKLASGVVGKTSLETPLVSGTPRTPKTVSKLQYVSSSPRWRESSNPAPLSSYYVAGKQVEGTRQASATPRVLSCNQVNVVGGQQAGVPPLPRELLANKSQGEKRYLEELNVVDHAGAVSTSKMPHVPLPLLEQTQLHHRPESRPPSPNGRWRSMFPLVRVRSRRGGSCEITSSDFKRFLTRLQAAASGYYDDMKRLVQGPFDLIPVEWGTGSGQAAYYQTAAAPHCPQCGYQTVLTLHGMPEAGAFALSAPPSMLGVPAKEGCADRLARWHCSLCGDVAAAVDEELLGFAGSGPCGEAGDRVDQFVAEGIHGLAEYLKHSCFALPRVPQRVVEGYPLYEPDPSLSRKERPTSLTGNMCVDQLNAFLDACLVEPHKMKELPSPPPIPDTQQTGNWFIDATNAILDRCHDQFTPPLPPPPEPKPLCPPLEMLIPPCCKPVELPPAPPPRTQVCPLLSICQPRAKECPHCHQPIGMKQQLGGTCPADKPRERGSIECCLMGESHFVDEPEPTRTYGHAPMGQQQRYVEVPRLVIPADAAVSETAPKVVPVSPARYRTAGIPKVYTYEAAPEAWTEPIPRQVALKY
ncbi:hypothetical protein BESB_054200 [Besnoitia besnoiti]|uniref:Uncharacterized protein n=1 Tax=Besnoitia besnoiti TaxID=94643 RepID=A0A2A9MD15_BESBE|nr:hypothetical protein BESB_054200 [Besnoitia besnoiti]PFH35769.1 hypothetical protein BESB_054200 [Besnoitia besnoiti]